MREKLVIISILFGLLFSGLVFAVVTSYDSITGAAVVEQSITLDIIGSSNDDNYTLSDVHQGETKWSPKIKIKNDADVTINVNLTVVLLPESAGNETDVTISIWNEDKNEILENPVNVSIDDMYFYVKHEFAPDANIGDYYFQVSAIPVG